jgi:hypothetical protein
MASVGNHMASARIFLGEIEEKLRKGTATERQKIIAFSGSEASCDILAILLHKQNLINPGFNINHRFFASDKIAARKLNFDFSTKDKIIPLVVRQEEYRNILCYGSPKPEKKVLECIRNLYKIKETVEKEGIKI